jgi:hypothetical protein
MVRTGAASQLWRNDEKSCSPIKPNRLGHRYDIQRLVDVPRAIGGQGVEWLRILYSYTASAIAAGVEAIVDNLDCLHSDVPWRQRIESAKDPVRQVILVSEKIGHLAEGMHAGIGASRAGDMGRHAEKSGNRLL